MQRIAVRSRRSRALLSARIIVTSRKFASGDSELRGPRDRSRFSVPLFLGNESAETKEEGDGRKFRLNSRAPAVEINIFPSNLGPLTQFFFHEEETGE